MGKTGRNWFLPAAEATDSMDPAAGMPGCRVASATASPFDAVRLRAARPPGRMGAFREWCPFAEYQGMLIPLYPHPHLLSLPIRCRLLFKCGTLC